MMMDGTKNAAAAVGGEKKMIVVQTQFSLKMGPGLEQKTCMKKTCMKKEKRLEQKTCVKKAGTMAIGPLRKKLA